MRWIKVGLVCCMLVGGLSGCASYIVPPGSPSMAQVYAAANQGQTTWRSDEGNNASVREPLHRATLPAISQIASSKIRVHRFPVLPNPQSVMMIFGHYAGNDQVPVPEHVIAFPLYTQTYYALPSEVQIYQAKQTLALATKKNQPEKP